MKTQPTYVLKSLLMFGERCYWKNTQNTWVERKDATVYTKKEMMKTDIPYTVWELYKEPTE